MCVTMDAWDLSPGLQASTLSTPNLTLLKCTICGLLTRLWEHLPVSSSFPKEDTDLPVSSQCSSALSVELSPRFLSLQVVFSGHRTLTSSCNAWLASLLEHDVLGIPESSMHPF